MPRPEVQKITHTAEDVTELNLPLPGEYPFTRGLHPAGYVKEAGGRLWTRRMFAGFGDAVETNLRFKQLLEKGQTGLSVAFDMPTLYGYDTDDPRAVGEFGTCGVACSNVRDMEMIFQDIPLDKVSVSMTINSPAAPIWAMLIAAAERQGVKKGQLKGTLQNDILKEYFAQKEHIFPPKPSMRLVVDTVEYATEYIPAWNPISISGYHIREAGSTAVQELAFTLADGMAYVEACVQRGIPIDSFAPRLSFFFDSAFPQGGATFFDEIAKFRAARTIWAKAMRETYGAENERSWWLRFHTQTSGASLTAQEPMNNITRVALQALAAVLGGTQSLHTNAYDEALAVPTAGAAEIALLQQLVIAYETGVKEFVDPLGGSYLIETLTAKMEKEARDYIEKIRILGNGSMLEGVLRGIEVGFMESEIAQSAVNYQAAIDAGRQTIIGVNAYQGASEAPTPILRVNPESLKRQLAGLQQLRSKRNATAVHSALEEIRQVCRGNENIMPSLIKAAHAEATLGEMMNVMREEFGEY